jgi:hypothetical protein
MGNGRKEESLMSDVSSSTNSGGVGFTGLLTIVFIVLKLTGVISWSWWWVLSPVWITALLVVAVLLVVVFFKHS